MKNLTLFVFIAFFAFSISSCRKEKDTTATVTIVDAAQQPVAGVTVRLYCPEGTCNKPGSSLDEDMDRTATTNSSGKATFNYTEQYRLGQAGFAVLDVEVHLTAATGGTPEATGVIKIEEEVENEQTIICQTCP